MRTLLIYPMRTFLMCLGIVLGALPGSPAYAIHSRDIPTVTSLAHQLERTAEHVRRQAEANAHHFGPAEHQTLRSLHRFAESANRFHGYRSSVAASLLKAKGYHQVFHVPGGFHAWKMRGFPVEN
jgi:rhodanese-related sulfurtransferase